MSQVEGLRVTVEGDLPEEILTGVGEAVRQTVLVEVAKLDLAPKLHEVPLEPADFAARAPSGEIADDSPADFLPILLGIWFKLEGEQVLP